MSLFLGARRHATLSAQQVDPFSWFTGRLVPLVFGALIVLYGGIMTIATWQSSGYPAQQAIAVVVCVLACVFVWAMTAPLRAGFGWAGGIIALTIGGLGLVLSAFGYIGAPELAIEVWWGPFALALVIASLAPFLPARTLVILGFAVIVITTPPVYLALRGSVPGWGAVSMVLIIVGTPVLAVVAAAIFSLSVVSRMLPLIEQRSRTLISADVLRGEEAEAVARERVARLGARAVPFIEGIARSGRVAPEDRALAGQLARGLRDDLVTQSSRSWLDAVARGSRLVVIDPERRADRMRPSQRTALRALLEALLRQPGTDAGSLLVELRGHDDGSTAVGVSLDIELPEGRRIMHLAPYYLALRTAVGELDLVEERAFRLSFRVPPTE